MRDDPEAVLATAITNVFETPKEVAGGLFVNAPHLMREGFFDLQGTAQDSDSTGTLYYQVLLLERGTDTVVANITPDADAQLGVHVGGDTAGDLGRLDFSLVENGVYALELVVWGGGQAATDRVAISIDVTVHELRLKDSVIHLFQPSLRG